MSETFVSRAPGKLFLLGEYAVLDGAPAVVAAIDRHVEVRLSPRAGVPRTRIIAPGHCEPHEMRRGDSSDAPANLRFALTALDAAARRMPALADAGFDVEILSELENGAEIGQKLGLGGSAAVSAAIVAAVFAAGGRGLPPSSDEIFATAFAAHRDAQRGVGSGADIAASVYGGVLLFEPQPEALPRVRRLRLPEKMQMLVGWSGTSAATGPLVERYLALEARGARATFQSRSRQSVDSFVEALDTGWLSPRSVDANGEALERLARDAELPLLTPELDRLIALARAAGAGAKLSGAGGGDCAIALTDDGGIAERVRNAWIAASLRPLDLAIEPGGVSVAKG